MMAYRIAFGDIKIGEFARRNVNEALGRHWISQGENVARLEQEFARKFGFKHAISTSSGTAADIAACAALYSVGAERGDEIIVPACCFVACANSILAAGFIPKFVDIELESLNIDPNQIERAITPKTRGIMVVHNMGKPAALDEIMGIAFKRSLYVIEDCCEAHGAMYRHRKIGTIGDMATYSFYPAHLIVAGEGGMVGTNNDDLAKELRSIISHGRPPESIYFSFDRFGLNLRMHELAAAIAREGLQGFEMTFSVRKDNIAYLLKQVDDLRKWLLFLNEEPYEISSPHAFPLVIKPSVQRDDLKLTGNVLYTFLEEAQIQCKTLFGSLPTQHKVFEFLGYKRGDFPVAEYVGLHGLHFGIHQYLVREDLDWVSDVMHRYFKDLS